MKIGILTQPLRTNYGGLLQNYALQTVLRRMGHSPITLNRNFKIPFYIKFGSILKRSFLRLFNRNLKVRSWMNKKEIRTISQNISKFIVDNITVSKNFSSSFALKKLHKKEKMNAYIVGSDQVWRPIYSPNIYNYFLDFVSNDDEIIKLSYAASFGVDTLEFTAKQIKKCTEFLKKFHGVSVRENSALDLCKQYFETDADNVLDPTLLLEKDDYIELVRKKKITSSKGNLFVYLLDKKNEKSAIVDKVAAKFGLLPFEVMPEVDPYRYFDKVIKDDIDKCIYPPVEQWLRAFMDAKYIITDSFHGTVFSIIFQKQFITIQNTSRGNSRFYSLLGNLGIENRIINDDIVLDNTIFDEAIDYSLINSRLSKLKSNSIAFLEKYLS